MPYAAMTEPMLGAAKAIMPPNAAQKRPRLTSPSHDSRPSAWPSTGAWTIEPLSKPSGATGRLLSTALPNGAQSSKRTPLAAVAATAAGNHGDGVRQDGTPYGPECKGHWVITASRRPEDGKPWVCDISNPSVELAPQDAYSGMYARCTIHFFGYNTAGKKGVGCSLDGVMKTRDGESLGGAVKPTANEFAQFAQAAQAAADAQPRINPLTGLPM